MVFGIGRGLKKVFMREDRLDRRSAAKFAQILTNVDKLDIIEKNIEINANSTRPKTRKVNNLLDQHEKLVEKITEPILEVMRNEFVTSEMDVNLPRQTIKHFLGLLNHYHSEIVNPHLKREIVRLFNDIKAKYEEFWNELNTELVVVDELYSRQIQGETSAFAHALGNVHDLVKVMRASDEKKQSLDRKIRQIKKDIKGFSKKIEAHLKNSKQEIDVNEVLEGKSVFGAWYRIGDKEFKQKLVRKRFGVRKFPLVYVRDAGSKSDGSIAGKKVMVEAEIPYIELIRLFRSFEQEFVTLTGHLWNRSKNTKEILMDIGNLIHRIKQRGVVTQKKVDGWLKESDKALALADKKMAQEASVIKENQKRFKQEADRTVISLKASRRAARPAIKRAAAILIGASTLVKPIGAIGEPVNVTIIDHGNKSNISVQEVEVNVKEVFENKLGQTAIVMLQDNIQFPFDSAIVPVDSQTDVVHLLPELQLALQQAARDAGFSDYKEFVQKSDFHMTVSIVGKASFGGADWYNLGLSQERAVGVEAKLQQFADSIGMSIEFKSVEGKGEHGHQEFLKMVEELLKDPTAGNDVVKSMTQPLDKKAERTLRYFWGQYQDWSKIEKKVKSPKKKLQARRNKAWSLEQMAKAVRAIDKVDAVFLAPYRSAELKIELNYSETINMAGATTKKKVKTTIAAGDELPSPVIAASDIFDQKAILTAHSFQHPKFAQTVPDYKGKERKGFQRFIPRAGAGGCMKREPM